MSPIVHGFDWPDRVVIGTVGQPGARAFYLQVRAGARLESVALEKGQADALANTIDEVLDQLAAEHGNPFNVPSTVPAELVDNDPLEQPVSPDFRVGGISIGWDPATAQLIIEAQSIVVVESEELERATIDPESLEPEEVLQIRIPVGAARAFAERTAEVVGAGRPPGD